MQNLNKKSLVNTLKSRSTVVMTFGLSCKSCGKSWYKSGPNLVSILIRTFWVMDLLRRVVRVGASAGGGGAVI